MAGLENDPTIEVAIAFPAEAADRDRVRRLINHPLPAIVPGSVTLPCERCALALAVGPRTAATATTRPVRILCPMCFGKLTADLASGDIVGVINLGNPDSKFENEN